MIFKEITIIYLKKPKDDLNHEIQWLSESLGLFGHRDRERSCFRIFLELIKTDRSFTSDEIAACTRLTRGTVIHHLDRLMDAGIVVSHKNRYTLRVNRLEKLVSEIREDILATLEQLEGAAKELDWRLHPK